MKKVLMFAVAIVVGITNSSFSHVPTVIPRDLPEVHTGVYPIEYSQALYASFEKSVDVDGYHFWLNENDVTDTTQVMEDASGEIHSLIVTDENGVTGRRVHFGSIVPACGVYETILPTIAFVGPVQKNLPEYDGSIPLPENIDLEEGEGISFLTNATQGPLIYEVHTYKSYFDQLKKDVVVNKAGAYKIYIWDANGNEGDYVLELGHIEVFDTLQILQSSFWLFHIVEDGEISNDACKDQLVEIDGLNPSFFEVIKEFTEH
ncbi:MAG: hypothetical protein GY710_17455 [Desulfobacteraceae bacterium]|nr:hypothetical protein [Desulfobacteraceae bacterium]